MKTRNLTLMDIREILIHMRAQSSDRPHQPAVFPGGFLQLLLRRFAQLPQKSQKLTVELARVPFIDQDPTLIELPLNPHQLFVFMLMSPANIGQYIQTIGALR